MSPQSCGGNLRIGGIQGASDDLEQEKNLRDETWFVKRTKESVGSTVPFTDEVTQHEKELIEATLKESKGRVSVHPVQRQTWNPRQTLHSRIKVLGVDKYRFKVR